MNSLTQIPTGTQILIGEAVRRRRRVERTIFSVFEGWSYREIIPPMFDYLDVFVKGMGRELEDRIYRFIDREGNILALRPEFTSLLAKMAATRLSGEEKPIRLSYSGEVLRFETPKGGQQREFAQMGIEQYGASSSSADIEVLLICVEALQKLGVPDFQINLGSVDFFGGIVDRIGLPQAGIEQLKELLNRKDQSGLRRMLAGLRMEERRKNILMTIPQLTGGRETLEEATRLVRNERSLQAIAHLEAIYSSFRGPRPCGPSDDRPWRGPRFRLLQRHTVSGLRSGPGLRSGQWRQVRWPAGAVRTRYSGRGLLVYAGAAGTGREWAVA